MKPSNLIFAFVLLAGLSLTAPANTSPDELARLTASTDAKRSLEAVRELRALGAPGLDALFREYSKQIGQYKLTGKSGPEWKRIAGIIDSVAMQKDAYASRLYWYTDLDSAKRAASKQKKPILSLRLLGDLNEEFSCANSRLFRAILYPNAEISKYLRENYILHWRSVRPAPRITIDFGDGRKIERTITGNSIHYILDDSGMVIDGLPGLYSPKVFLSYLKKSRAANDMASTEPEGKRRAALMRYRKSNYDKLVEKRNTAFVDVDADVEILREPVVRAIDAAPLAATKSIVVGEVTLLRILDGFSMIEPSIDFGEWTRLARSYSPENGLDADSTAFIRRQNARTGMTEVQFEALFSKLDEYIALDTTRNELMLHPALYSWLNTRPDEDVESLNSRVYDELFRTPASDKWLGLYQNDVYTALDGNGIIQ